MNNKHLLAHPIGNQADNERNGHTHAADACLATHHILVKVIR